MPLATIKMIEGVFSGDEKQRMIEKVTEAMLSVEGENLRDYTLVILEEVKSGDWASWWQDVDYRRCEATAGEPLAVLPQCDDYPPV